MVKKICAKSGYQPPAVRFQKINKETLTRLQTLGENELEGENPELENSDKLRRGTRLILDDTVMVTVATEKAASAPATLKQIILKNISIFLRIDAKIAVLYPKTSSKRAWHDL